MHPILASPMRTDQLKEQYMETGVAASLEGE